MMTKMYLGEILLFFLVALYGHVNCGTPIIINLVDDGEIQSVQTPRYPKYVSPFTSITWELNGLGVSHLELQCSNITLSQTLLKRGTLLLEDKKSVIDIGRSNFTRRLSEGRSMKIHLKTQGSFARIKCSVRLNRIKVDVSEAPDSRELGFGSQQRRSTSCPCGETNKANSKKRIIGGRETLPNEFVFMAYLRRLDEEIKVHYYQQCTGSILTKRHILTAAHCLVYYPKVEHEVVVGGHDLVNGSTNGVAQTMKIHKIHPHESYQADIHLHDIGIIELTEDIEFIQFVRPVCLPSESYNLTNQWVKAMGWGKLYTVSNASRTLQTVNLKVIDMKECMIAYPNPGRPEIKLCFYSPKGATCTGDSGGPLVYYDSEIDRYVQVASVSYGGTLCKPGEPSVGVNVFLYLDWIKEVIARESSGLPICQKV